MTEAAEKKYNVEKLRKFSKNVMILNAIVLGIVSVLIALYYQFEFCKSGHDSSIKSFTMNLY